MFLRSLFLVSLVTCIAFSAPRFEVVCQAPRANSSMLIEGLDGAIYGSTDGHTIIRVARDGARRVLYRFDEPFLRSLIAAPDGNLYGAVGNILFRLSYRGALDVLHEFSPDQNHVGGDWPASLVLAPDGNLYGITLYGGVDGRGTLFRLRLDGEFTRIADFPAPYSTILSITVGPDGALWGRAAGGTNYAVQIFRATLDGAITNPITSGALPGPLLALFTHSDGNLYGLARQSPNAYTPALLRITARGEMAEVQRFGGPPYIDAGLSRLGNDGQIYFGTPDFDARVNSQQILRVSAAGELTKVIGPVNGSFVRLNEMAPLITHDGWLYVASSGPNWENGVIGRLRLPDYPEANLPPYARPDYVRPPKPGESAWIRLLANDSDVNGDSISLIGVSAPEHGTIEVDAARGRVRYTAPAGEPVIEDSFTYRVSDGKGGVGIGRVTARANIRGTFADLLLSSSANEDGRIGATLSKFGAISGRIWLGGFSRKFAGHLDSENRFSVTFSDLPPAVPKRQTLTFELQMEGREPIISAKLEGPETSVTAELTRPNPYLANKLAGAYTFALPSNPAWKNQPASIQTSPLLRPFTNPVATALGDGFGMLRLSKNGLGSAVGKMPDGSPFSAGQALDRSGRLLFFAPLRTIFSTRGWLRGPVDFDGSSPGSDASGTLLWALPKASYSDGDGFLKNAVLFVGSRFVATTSLQDTLGLSPRFQVDPDGGVAPFTSATRVTGDVISGGAPFISGGYSRTFGILGGHFSPSGTNQWVGYNGIVLQKQRRVVGQFRAVSKRGTGGFAIARE